MTWFFALILAQMAVFTPPTEGGAHAYHISKTDIRYSADDKALQITMHIFIDDLEAALEQRGHSKLFVGTELEKPEAYKHIYSYLVSQFAVKINNKPVAIEWVGKEPAKDRQALWVYLEAKNVKNINTIYVDNKLLTEIYSDQKNIVSVVGPKNKEGYFLFDRNKTGEGTQF